MSGSRRAGFAFLVVAGAVLAYLAFSGPPGMGPGPSTAPTSPGPAVANGPVAPGPVAAGRARVFRSASDCAECHKAVFAEWQATFHRTAGTDPDYLMLADNRRMPECISCHVPQPIHLGVVGERVYERSARVEDGVDCLTCHLLPEGGVAASRDLPSAPCAPHRVETLSQSVTCKGCHNQHQMYDDWEGMFAHPDPGNPDPEKRAVMKEGRPEGCLDCHMPPVERAGSGADGGKRMGRSHDMQGGHYLPMLQRAAKFAARVEGGKVIAETTNAGAGHKLPADARHRSANVYCTVLNEAGEPRGPRTEIAEYRMYYRQEFKPHTNLRPGETGVATFDLPRGMKGMVLVELGYALSPDRKIRGEVTILAREEIPFDTTK